MTGSRGMPRGLSRRGLIAGAAALGASAALLPPPAAAGLRPTPGQPAGPYYPGHLDLTTLDSDLTHAPAAPGLVRGALIDLAGTVRDPAGRPITRAEILIWQADTVGRYNHPADSDGVDRDPHFEGAGVERTDDAGRYRFRTVKPAPYPRGGAWQRAPHIHMAIETADGRALVTQMYFPDEPLNAEDGLYRRLGDAVADAVAERGETRNGVTAFAFDIVLDAESR